MQLMNFCMEESIIEFVVFWLDTEHFKHFDGNDDDIKLFAHHISEWGVKVDITGPMDSTKGLS